MSKYILQPSTQSGSWVLTDTTHGLVVTFEDGKFSETQHVTILEDMPKPSESEWARAMQELGEWAARYHGSKCFSSPYGIEYSEDGKALFLYRRKAPCWRLELKDYDEVDAAHLATTLRKAAEWLTKR